MKKLAVFLKDYKKESISAPLFKMLEAVLELFVPLVVKSIIDTGIAFSNKPYIYKMCGLLAVFAAVGLVFSITAQYFAAKAAVGFSKNLLHSLFEHIGSLSYNEIDSLGTGALITRMTSDVNQVQSGVNLTLRLLLRSPFVVFGAVIMAFTVDTKSALVFAGTVPVLAGVVFGIMLAGIPLYKKAQKNLDRVTSLARENLAGARVIRAFGREKAEIKQFSDTANALCTSQKTAGRVSALMNPLTYVLINAAIIVLIYTGALRVNTGALTQGAVIALYNYMSQILVELIKLADLILNITKSAACAKRIESVFETSSSMSYPEKSVEPDKNAPAVEFRNVALQYGGASGEALSNISFTAAKGERIGIIGSTGCGKSSLISLIPRFYDATGGEVLLFGKNVKDYTAQQLNSLIAMVPQRAVLFSGSIRENLLWGKKNADEKDIQAAISAAQCEDVLKSKANGLDEFIEQGGGNLSGGQKQRLTIARALIKKSPVLILDDAASALDLITEKRLRQAIGSLEEAPTVITVSQRASSVMGCDKILVLDDGALIASGTHEQLLKESAVYAEIYASQFSGGEINA